MEQKRAYDIVFSNHIDNEKGAQQVGLGYHEVFGLVFFVTILFGPSNRPVNLLVPLTHLLPRCWYHFYIGLTFFFF